jgi:predicted nucleic acid-binding protein
MEIVVDVSAILAVLLNEPERPALELATMGHDLVSPACVAWELGNALYGAIKRARIGVREAISVFSEFNEIPLRQINIDVASAIRIAATHKLPAYDAYYLECARAQRTSVLTLDARMLQVAAKMKIKTVEVFS